MSDNRNKLPVAVEIVSGGGSASQRVGGSVTSIEDTSGGSISLGTAKQFRVVPNLRSWTGKLFVLSYSNPASIANAEYIVTSNIEIKDTVPPNTTLYWGLLDASTLGSTIGGSGDYLIVTRYE